MEIKQPTFLISDIEFRLKEDLDLDEATKASETMSLFFSPNTATLSAVTSAEKMKEFFSTVLEPVKGNLPENFNWGKIKGKIQLQVFKTFFLQKLKNGINDSEEFVNSILDQPEQ